MTSTEQPPPKPAELNVAKVGSATEKLERVQEAEKEKHAKQEKTKREERAEVRFDNTSKRRRKEKTKKAGQGCTSMQG